MKLPAPRGPLSATVLDVLSRNAGVDAEALLSSAAATPGADPVTDGDRQLTLWVLYELHYGSFDGVADTWEWDPDLLRLRRELEVTFEAALRRRTEEQVRRAMSAPGDVPDRIFDLVESAEGPSLARFVQREATREQLLVVLAQRSIYTLKEADPSTWVIPRITGRAKAALVELQYDEYGAGRPDRLHATLFADAMEACGLSREYGAYLDQAPAAVLASNNAMSLLGLHRRLRAAAMGHLAAVEASSSLPCRRYAAGIRRLGLPETAAAYFDEHVEADAVHEQLATRNICAELVASDPSLLEDVFFGAAVSLHLDEVAATELLDGWEKRSAKTGEVA